MNKKTILIVSFLACLAVFVPLVAAQNQTGNILQTQNQSQVQVRDCDEGCLTDAKVCDGCLQNQTCLQDRQCLQTGDCNQNCIGDGTGICGGICDGTQTRQRVCQQEGIQAGLIGGKHCGQGLGKNCQTP